MVSVVVAPMAASRGVNIRAHFESVRFGLGGTNRRERREEERTRGKTNHDFADQYLTICSFSLFRCNIMHPRELITFANGY